MDMKNKSKLGEWAYKQLKYAINALTNLLGEYQKIGTPDECRAAVEKQKEMIAYCDENDCSDCPYHSGNQKENRRMNDFIAEQLKVGVDNEQID